MLQNIKRCTRVNKMLIIAGRVWEGREMRAACSQQCHWKIAADFRNIIIKILYLSNRLQTKNPLQHVNIYRFFYTNRTILHSVSKIIINFYVI
jgi:hypothetical protein